MPAPPYSSGTATPARPSSPAWSKKERGNSPLSSISLARGRTTSSANLRTLSCSIFCSSLSSILMAFLLQSDGMRVAGTRASGIVATGSEGVKEGRSLLPSPDLRHNPAHENKRAPPVHRNRDPQLPAHGLGPARRPQGRRLGPEEEGLAGHGDRQRRFRLSPGGQGRGSRQARPPGGPAPGHGPAVPRTAGVGRAAPVLPASPRPGPHHAHRPPAVRERGTLLRR